MGKTAKPPLCRLCGQIDPTKFYGHKKSYCGDCHNAYTVKVGQDKRSYAIERLGGCCVHCGFNSHSCALDIHHLDPEKKDKNFHAMRGWSLSRIDKELVGCILLCKNCHAIEHSG